MSISWQDLIRQRVVILDGSTGTLLQQRGLPAGASPEQYCLEHPEVIAQIQREYLDAGADILYTPTFGANRAKLRAYGLEEKAADLNRQLAARTVEIAHHAGRLAAGDVGPTGLFFAPFGETPFDEGIAMYAEQVRALAGAGVDLIVVETMIDVQEARIALLAAKEAADLPVAVSMTFDESGKTLTGSDPLTCLNILQSLGAAAFGINCSTGPELILGWARDLAPYARIPIMVKPNAGLPVVAKKQTVYPMEPPAFNAFAEKFHAAGVSLIGGCCGTTPDHIRLLADTLRGLAVQAPAPANTDVLLSSARRTIALSLKPHAPIRLIGERINPTGKPALQAELSAGRLDAVKALAWEQQAQGAELLDVNVGAPGVNETTALPEAAAELARASELPLCLDSTSPAALEAAVRLYPGRVLLNSLSGETAKLEKLLPVIRKYGCAFILLPLDDRGIPETVAVRRAILRRVLDQCAAAGIPDGSAVVDGLTLTIASNPGHAAAALGTLRHAAEDLHVPTVLGLSNISFGLPARPTLNSAFLSMAAGAGLSAVIANPSETALQDALAAANLLAGRDAGSRRFLGRFAGEAKPAAGPAAARAQADAIGQAVVRGEKNRITSLLDAELKRGVAAFRLLEDRLFPAIARVGDLYQRHELFLPQLIAAAETMEEGVRHLEPRLATAARRRKAKVVLATVQGDIHDIGKKIVALLLRNNGYEVIDLGKSVDGGDIIAQAQVREAEVIGLSALMTTTMEEMPKVIALARAKMPGVKVLVGGAVVTPAFARTIGADGYAADSVQAVKVLDQWFVAKPGSGKTAPLAKKIKTKPAARARPGRRSVGKKVKKRR